MTIKFKIGKGSTINGVKVVGGDIDIKVEGREVTYSGKGDTTELKEALNNFVKFESAESKYESI